MIVTLTSPTTPARVVFTWGDDLTSCDYAVTGMDHEAAQALVAHLVEQDAHEGAEVAGWTSEIRWS